MLNFRINDVFIHHNFNIHLHDWGYYVSIFAQPYLAARARVCERESECVHAGGGGLNMSHFLPPSHGSN